MNHKLLLRNIGLSLVALMSMAGFSFASQKFDATLAGAMKRAGIERVVDGSYKRMRLSAKVEVVKILVRFSDSNALDAIRNAGGTVNSVIGNIASVEMPASELGSLISIPEIQYMEAGKPIPLRLSSSVPATRANLIRSGVSPNLIGATGEGVIVGVVDDGLDFRSLDFRNTDGSTRLLGLWDQRVTGAAGLPPSGYSYGGECSAQMINDAINGAGGCTQPSTGGHGTHVGGIAAGNGQQTGNGQASYRFVGMAPKADILVANSLGGGAGGDGNAIVDAIAWMKTKAAALGKPLVINLSLGSYFGARDGTSNYEQALSNAGAAGVVITAAAGNEGSDKLVATGQISTGQTKSVTFNWANTVTQDQKIEMWYPGVNQYAIKLTGPNGCAMPEFVLPDTVITYDLACGTLDVTSTSAQANNDDRQIRVVFTVKSTNPTGFYGDWTIELRGDVITAAETNFSLICGEDSSGLLFTSNTSAGYTLGILTDTSSATRTIAVASYNTNSSWLTTGGVPNTPSNYIFGPLTDVSTFSSRGPRRNCSNLSKCPVVMKPEITAPGAMIMSTLAIDAAAPTDDSIEADGKHVAFNGTSMATPHVTGAVALMLQKNPSLTPEQIKQILFQNVQTNAFTIGLPAFNSTSPLMPATTNDNWGYGILDIQAAYNAVASNIGIEFYNAGIDHYFMTANPDEATALDAVTASPRWIRTGKTWFVWKSAASSLSPVCRFFGTDKYDVNRKRIGANSHFYTADSVECDSVKTAYQTLANDGSLPFNGQLKPAWTWEENSFYAVATAGACPSGTTPIYRLYNDGQGGQPNHRYYTDMAVKTEMLAKGWVAEPANGNPVMCGPTQ